MALIRWWPTPSIILIDARQSLGEIVALGVAAPGRWIIIERHEPWRAQPYFYAFVLDELQDVLRRRPQARTLTALEALDLHETGESRTVPAGATSTDEPAANDPAYPSAGRVVTLGAGGRPVEIGQLFEARRGARRAAPPPPAAEPEPTLGPLRGPTPAPAAPSPAPPPPSDEATVSGQAATPPVPARVDVMLSAQGPQEIAIGQEDLVDVRIELAAAATPLAHAVPASIAVADPITVILSVEPGRLKIVGPRSVRLDPPSEDRPSITSFQLQGLAPGRSRIAVMFRQGASDLGTIAFDTTVVTASAQPGRTRAEATALPRDERDDDDVLVLLVDEEKIGDTIQYRYRVYSKALGLNFNEFMSEPVKPVAGGAAAATLDYVESIHRRIVERVLAQPDDLRDFDVELEGLGLDLCRQLFSADFVRKLWERRGDIGTVQITSWEPYIPWEMLRLRHPDTQEVDDRFLGEYGLVRAYSGNTRPRVLHVATWRYLIGEYPHGTLSKVAAEEPYLTRKLPASVKREPIELTPSGLLTALAQGDFDVLHISCHGHTDMNEGQRTELLISDRDSPGGKVAVTVSATTVAARARLAARTPLVFLNACETGRQTASLTRWGGWSRTFFEAGAGAFVGTSWSVHDKPAARFAEAFYEALRGGQSLAEAAVAGRKAAKQVGGASWLAYVVYGNPNARVQTD
jgi:hypothetical protein